MSLANKKIAMITERIDVALGGAERSVFELTDALSALGLEVDIIAAKGQANAKNVHILCQDTPGRRTGYFTFAKAVQKHLSVNHYCLVHSILPFDFADVYQPRAGCYAESVLRNAVSYQNKVIELYKRITAFANLRRDILLRAERKLCENPNGPVIAALSMYIAEQFKKYYGIDDDRIVVVPNGVKINKEIDTPWTDKLRSQILTQLGLEEADNPVFFLFAANNFRLKGLACLIKAMRLVSPNVMGRKAYLIIAGNGRTNKYLRLSKKLGVHRKIVFLGAVRHIQDVLSIIDVAVLPTFYDPSSRFILEAIAAGKPVITTKFNGAADLFVNDRHGKVIDRAENIQALAQAISFFTDTNNIRKASHAIVADNLAEKVSVSRVAKQLIPVYESILEKRGK
ncbi:MAG: glycosyltransferase family 4 protein [Phycisphaerae bacterium]|nr:glycosyltransferase family 4 protein [Phycisphaerae bacterium]MDD5381306.1 glycosyltransferase family 4 protein [Phycisphaerae bacterium]